VRSICGSVVRLGFTNDDIEMEPDLWVVARRMVGVAIVRVRGETDVMVACDVRCKGKLALSWGCGIYQEMLIGSLLQSDNSNDKGS
jgi:hypothetical protein